MVERFQRWFEYEKDSHQAARRLWLFRLDVIDRAPDDLFPTNVPLESLELAVSSMHSAWTEYLDNLNSAELEREFEYTSYEGDRCRNTIVDILTQLFGHSWYHRGQIASLLRSMDCEPAVTDFVFWSRRTVSQ